MASLKYRIDTEEENQHGQVIGYTLWMAGKTLARIRNCRHGDRTVTAYITGEPTTFWTTPARINVGKRSITGHLTCEDNLWTFHPHT